MLADIPRDRSDRTIGLRIIGRQCIHIVEAELEDEVVLALAANNIRITGLTVLALATETGKQTDTGALVVIGLRLKPHGYELVHAEHEWTIYGPTTS
jgi:hypothetical protein